MGYVAGEPRWRGEHVFEPVTMPSSDGLSPLARGTRQRLVFPDGKARFIPAGAGNTKALDRYVNAISVYPRWRGEHPNEPIAGEILTGLSPLARGTRGINAMFGPLVRFIPAGAGNTGLHFLQGILYPVYPRWRGEHPSVAISMRLAFGLSPLARGTLDDIYNALAPERFIPAGAGNTRCCSGDFGYLPVYPRWRGEHC